MCFNGVPFNLSTAKEISKFDLARLELLLDSLLSFLEARAQQLHRPSSPLLCLLEGLVMGLQDALKLSSSLRLLIVIGIVMKV